MAAPMFGGRSRPGGGSGVTRASKHKDQAPAVGSAVLAVGKKRAKCAPMPWVFVALDEGHEMKNQAAETFPLVAQHCGERPRGAAVSVSAMAYKSHEQPKSGPPWVKFARGRVMKNPDRAAWLEPSEAKKEKDETAPHADTDAGRSGPRLRNGVNQAAA
eukprot:g11691.t1